MQARQRVLFFYRRIGVPVHTILIAWILASILPDDHPVRQWRESVGLVGWVLQIAGAVGLGYAVYGVNVAIFRLLDRRLPVLASPTRRMMTQFTLSLLANAAVMAAFFKSAHALVGIPIGSIATLQGIVVGLLLATLTSTAYTGLYFFTSWLAEVDRHRDLEQRMMQWQMDALRAQLDPHLLFNSLTTLSTLISEGSAAALPFVDHLARMYRYVLRHRQNDIVSVEAELDMLRSSAFLLNERFADGVVVDIDVPAPFYRRGVPPLTLPMLVENAIKHNAWSRTKPLSIRIHADMDDRGEDVLVVTNVRRRRNPGPTDAPSTGLGLDNLRQRYDLLLGRQPVVEETEEAFTVVLPLLELHAAKEAHESHHH